MRIEWALVTLHPADLLRFHIQQPVQCFLYTGATIAPT